MAANFRYWTKSKCNNFENYRSFKRQIAVSKKLYLKTNVKLQFIRTNL